MTELPLLNDVEKCAVGKAFPVWTASKSGNACADEGNQNCALRGLPDPSVPEEATGLRRSLDHSQGIGDSHRPVRLPVGEVL